MNVIWVDRLVLWIADMCLLSSALLMTGLIVMHWLRQPARRIAVARSIAAGLAALAVLTAAPGWPRAGRIDWLASAPAPIRNTVTATVPIEPAMITPVVHDPTSATIGPAALAAAVNPQTVSDPPPGIRSTPSFERRPWQMFVGRAFLVGAALNLAWLALGAVQASRLRRSLRAATPRLQLLLGRISVDPRHPPRLCLSTRVGLPVAIGVVGPMIVLPEGFAETESDDRLEAALAHEWAHIQNGDLLWLAWLRLLNVVFFAQPLFWWLRRTIRADQEALADAAASALHGDGRVAYAETLIGWARSSHGPRPGALASAALALWERPTLLHRRVRLLLDSRFRVEPIVSRSWRLGAACLGLVGALALSQVTTRPPAAIAQDMKAQQGVDRPTGSASPKAAETGERFDYAGRVLDPDGKPIAGAKLHLAYFGYKGQAPPAVRATSDSQGRFGFTIAKSDFTETNYDKPWTTAIMVARADGFGLGWSDAFEKEGTKIDPRNLSIRLVRDDTPISGRLLDLQGRPVVGPTIRLEELLEPEQGDLSAWITASTTGKGGSYEIEREYLKRKLWPRSSGLPIAIATDAEGRFSIRGVGRERVIRLTISGPTIQTKQISVLTRTRTPFQVTHGRGSPDWGIALYYGDRFVHAAAPTKAVVGVVRDKDTGKPLAGVRIASNRTAEFPVYGLNGIETTTDKDGRYRLVGLPKGIGNEVIAIPAKRQNYLASHVVIPDTTGLDPVSLDIGLKPGTVIEGRIIDRKTGRPLKAYVEYNAHQDNPHLADAPGFKRADVWGRFETEPDGSYRVVGLPGRGLVAALFIGGGKQYLTGIGLPQGASSRNTLPVVPNSMLGYFNAFSEIDVPKDTATVRCDLALESGVTRTVRVVDIGGRPLAGALIKFQPDVTNLSPPQRTAEFQVDALWPDEKRVLDAFHEELKLAGSVEVRAADSAIAELKLLPWGTVVGRLVDEDGGARAKVDLIYSERDHHPATTDSQGRFRIEGIVPGKPTKIWVSPLGGFLSGTIGKDLVLGSGELKDLGEVHEKRQ